MFTFIVSEDEDDSGDNKAALSFKERRREAHTQVNKLNNYSSK